MKLIRHKELKELHRSIRSLAEERVYWIKKYDSLKKNSGILTGKDAENFLYDIEKVNNETKDFEEIKRIQDLYQRCKHHFEDFNKGENK